MSSEQSHANDAKIAKTLVKSALQHIPFDGWTMSAVQMAADEEALTDADIDRLLPDGVRSAIEIYGQMADDEMVAEFESLSPQPDKIHLKIRALILIRLEQAAPHKEVVRKTLAYLAKPEQAKLAAELLYKTVDTMWRAAGDNATDASFYTKRATLSAVYSATLLAFLGDDTADMAKTKAFLDRRLSEVAKIPKFTAPLQGAVRGLSQMVQSITGKRRAG